MLSALTVSAAPADALTVTRASVARGAVQVTGRNAAPKAVITWEGQEVVHATANGAFRFSTPILPPDCTGELSDGIAALTVVVQGCGPQGVPGPPAPFRMVDANGKTVGTFLGFTDNLTAVIVALTFSGRTFPAHIYDTDILASISSVMFEADNCEGTPFVPNIGVAPAVSIVDRSTFTVYIADGPVQPIIIRSMLDTTGYCRNRTPDPYSSARRAAILGDLSTVLTPPFRLEAE
jgi:hypothetical protein